MKRRAIALAALAAVLAACGGSSGSKQDGTLIPVRAAITASTALPGLPMMLAQSLGYYRQEGLDVTLNDVAGGSKALESIVGGSADVASSFFEELVLAASHQRDLQAFALTGVSPALALAVSPASSRRISKIEDLKGASVGVTTPGSPTHMILNFLLVQHGVAPESVSAVGLGSSVAREAALERGKVDAAVISEPGFTMLLRRYPNTVVLASMYTAEDIQKLFATPTYPGLILFSTPQWLRERPAAARGMARAIKRALAWIHSHSPEEIQKQAPQPMQIEDKQAFTEAIRRMLATWSPDGVMHREGVEAVIRMLAASNPSLRDLKLDPAKLYTNEFVMER